MRPGKGAGVAPDDLDRPLRLPKIVVFEYVPERVEVCAVAVREPKQVGEFSMQIRLRPDCQAVEDKLGASTHDDSAAEELSR